jgi:predicted DNA-binding transcriptional regulator AlpA
MEIPMRRKLSKAKLGTADPALSAASPLATNPSASLFVPPASPTAIEQLLDDHELESITGRARSTWQKARLTGDGPPFIRLGRLVRYRRSDVEKWLAAHARYRSTSEKAA